ncbi:MAG: hypothetical protein AABX30_00930 [Nanoarchaeota archaeon]
MAKKESKGKKTEEKKEEVCETFVIEKDRKEKIVESCGEINNDKEKEEIKKRQNKQLKTILIFSFIIMISFAGVFYMVNSSKNFKYMGLDFQKLKEGDVTFYKTTFPMYLTGKHIADYNIYIRNNPGKLDEKIPFEGDLKLTDMFILNMTGDFNCNGDGIIAIANFQQVMNVFNVKIAKDDNATCDELGRYGFIKIQAGEKSMIKNTGPKCYEFNIANCEILKVTERFLLEVMNGNAIGN